MTAVFLELLGLALLALWLAPWSAHALLMQLPISIPPGVLPGLGLVALMPAAASSAAWTHLSRGNMAMSFGLLAASTLLSPLVLAAQRKVEVVDSDTTALTLAVWVVFAIIASSLVRWRAGAERVAAVRPQRKLLSTAVLLVLNYSNAATALPEVFATFDLRALFTTAAIVTTCCASGYLVAWLLTWIVGAESAIRRAIVFGVGMKNTGMALVLAGLWLESQPLATLAIILYTLCQHVFAAAYHQELNAFDAAAQCDSSGSEP